MRAAARSAIACASPSWNASTCGSRRWPIAPRRVDDDQLAAIIREEAGRWPGGRRATAPAATAMRRGGMSLKIALLPGDGIGPEVTAEAVRMLKHVGEHSGHDVLVSTPRRSAATAIDATAAGLPERDARSLPGRGCGAARRRRPSEVRRPACRRNAPKRRCWRCARRSAGSPTCVRRSATRARQSHTVPAGARARRQPADRPRAARRAVFRRAARLRSSPATSRSTR